MERESLESLSRKDLQQLAKEHGLKANKKSVDLIQELLNLFSATAVAVAEGAAVEVAVAVEDEKKEIRAEKIESITTHEIINTTTELPNPVPTVNSSVTAAETTPAGSVFSGEKSDLKVSDEILFEQNLKVIRGKIKRLNKLSVRVVLDEGSELTIPYSDIRGFSVPAPNETLPEVNEQSEDLVSPEVEEDQAEASGHLESMEPGDARYFIIDTIEEANDESTVCDGMEDSQCVRDSRKYSIADASVYEAEDAYDPAAESEADDNTTQFRDQIPGIESHDNMESEVDEESVTNLSISEDVNETDQSISTPMPLIVGKCPPLTLFNDSEETDMNVCGDEEDLKVAAFLWSQWLTQFSP